MGDRRGVNGHQVIHPASFQNYLCLCLFDSEVVTLLDKSVYNAQTHTVVLLAKKYLNFKLTSLKKQYLILDIIAKRDANHKT